jgi:hypothetical protein
MTLIQIFPRSNGRSAIHGRSFLALSMLAMLLLPAGLSAQQCANQLQWPHWVWQTLEWVDEMGLDNDIYDATYYWQQQNANTIIFEASFQYQDIIFEYAVLDPGVVGSTIAHTQQENSQCYHKTDYCGICMNGECFIMQKYKLTTYN